ncbi:hypothetical protein PoB_003058300 [Plakobranchus ocellatus]|uniref:Uncharacterized protein n=1 Tax=Plakobranchus ocellatus TaxID=259542 RepID=A0AAV4ABV5_9GAST|nr:hypothetical protein PoB_003058300 [Plakobranchus ocellatus]
MLERLENLTSSIPTHVREAYNYMQLPNNSDKVNITNIVNNHDGRVKFQQQLDTHLVRFKPDQNTPNETWHIVKQAIQISAQETASVTKRTKPNRTPDKVISGL